MSCHCALWPCLDTLALVSREALTTYLGAELPSSSNLARPSRDQHCACRARCINGHEIVLSWCTTGLSSTLSFHADDKLFLLKVQPVKLVIPDRLHALCERRPDNESALQLGNARPYFWHSLLVLWAPSPFPPWESLVRALIVCDITHIFLKC